MASSGHPPRSGGVDVDVFDYSYLHRRQEDLTTATIKLMRHSEEAMIAISDMLSDSDVPRIAYRICSGARRIASRAELFGRVFYMIVHVQIPERATSTTLLQIPCPEQVDDMLAVPMDDDVLAVLMDDNVLAVSMDDDALGDAGGGFGGVPAPSASIEKLDRMRYRDEEGRGWCRERACSICMDEFEEGVRLCKIPCSHAFHEECLTRWLERSRLCPLCRYSV
ncbi:E3 ubiquitin-protein ligase RING1-like, partial [Ananas comosus]